ncbi:MAG: hypothetical protein AB1664_18905, partial [Thermodesulfobacteriota bacterium]
MTKHLSRRALMVCAGVVLSCLFIISTVLAADPIGTIRRVQGQGFILRAGQAEPVPAKAGDPTFLQDTIMTDNATDSKIWWRQSKVQSDVSLGRGSVFRFEGVEVSGPSSQFAGQMLHGIVRFRKKLPQTNPPSSFVVLSPTAFTAAMPTPDTADFVIESLTETRTSITCIRGELLVFNIREDLQEDKRLLRSCQAVIVEKDQPPSNIMQVSPEYMRALIDFTTIRDTLPRDVPSCRTIPPPSSPVPPIYYEPIDPGVIVVPGFGPGLVPVPIPVPVYPTTPTAPTMPTTP